jgi:TetR/AcrR family transcriptional regulator, transcriptional repressor of bet genes
MPRPSNTAQRRDQIVRGLKKVMARKGYDGAAVPQIAAAARVAPGIVHYHFRDKLEILLALLESLVAEHDAALEAALAKASGNPERELEAFIDIHLATGRTADPEALACWVAICGEAIRQPRVRAAFAQAITGATHRLASILRHGARTRTFRLENAEAAAAALMAAIQGYLVLAATARQLIPHRSAAPSAKAMAAGLLEG